MKLLAVLFIVSGEALAIYTEMLGARSKFEGNSAFLYVFLKLFGVIALGGGLLLAGYTLGFRAFKNIWVVSAVSIASIVIIEPILAYAVFQQLPTKGALAGLLLGVAGLVAAVFF